MPAAGPGDDRRRGDRPPPHWQRQRRLPGMPGDDMIRKLALVVCLVLLLLTAALWAVSHTTWGRASLQPRYVTAFAHGGDEIWLYAGISDERISLEVRAARPFVQKGPMRYSVALWTRSIRAPLWLVCPVIAATCALLAYLDRRSRRRHRISSGCCIRCGYNLTGNVSGVCPECGERI